jgi:hypothetical protein
MVRRYSGFWGPVRGVRSEDLQMQIDSCGGTMIHEGTKDIDEVFMVRSESITLFAALVRETADKSRIAGKIRFPDGSVTSFRHPCGTKLPPYAKQWPYSTAQTCFTGNSKRDP